MKRIFALLFLALFATLAFGQVETQDSLLSLSNPPATHTPLKIHYTAKSVAVNKVSLTFQFEQNLKYGINRKPEPMLDIVKGESSILPKKLAPADLSKDSHSQYYGKIAPVTVLIDRSPGLEAQFTYLFCSKKEGFCARKIDKVVIQLP